MVKSNKMRSKNNNKKKSSGASAAKRKAPAGRMIVPTRRMFDPPAAAYARLLADPCGAPLTHPLYAGGEGGILVKAESVINIAAGASETGVLMHWTPGAIGSGNTELLTSAPAGDSATATAASSTPGKTFLNDNATGVRVVAACMQVTYLGTELNRSGTIAMGRTQGSLIDPTNTVSLSGLSTALEHFTRTPDSTLELRWVPANMDQSFTDPNVATPTQERDRKSALTLSASGLVAASGLRIRLVAIYEYQPLRTLGIANPSSSRAYSSWSLDDVLNSVQKATNVIKSMSSLYGMRVPQIEL